MTIPKKKSWPYQALAIFAKLYVPPRSFNENKEQNQLSMHVWIYKLHM